ncbi:MAG TPA: MFS transporter [Paracoccaceae bacterium]|nr:MFS transporter [Paracoccaceae bacterium]
MTEQSTRDAAHAFGDQATSFSEAISRQPIRAWSIAAFVICLLVLISDGMDAQLLGIVAPLVRAEFGVDAGTFGIAMSAALVGFGLGSWGGGWLGDKIGRRWALALATIIFSLATIAASWSADVMQMALWRLVGGLGFGGAYSNAIALAGEWLPLRWRSVGVTTLSVGTPAGGLVVAALAPTLVDALGWRGTFVALGASTLVVVVVIVLALRESPSYLLAKGKVDEAHKVGERVLPAPFHLAPESHASDRGGSAIGVFDSSNFRLNLGVGIAFGGAALVAYGMLNWGTTFLTGKGFAFDEAAYAVSLGGLTSIASSIAAGLLVQRFGSRRMFLAISGSLIATLVVMMLQIEALGPDASDSERLMIVALYGLAAAIFSGGVASMYALMTHAYPPSCRSAGIGFGIFMSRVGAVGASLFGGTLIEWGDGSLLPFFGILIVAAALISAAAFVVDRHVPPARKG